MTVRGIMIFDKSTRGMLIPSTPNFKFTPILGIHADVSRNCIEEFKLLKPKNSINDIANDIIDVIKAIIRACCLVFAKNVMIAPIKEIAIINEIKATIMSLRI
jgi:hypothetical protein